jgi:Cache domain/Methyl-accepting chemotaxis protein (MCP) signalling domain
MIKTDANFSGSNDKQAAQTNNVTANLDMISQLSLNMGQRLDKAVTEIEEINSETRILALNAKIEAARTDSGSKAFGVVAAEMSNVSKRTSAAAKKLDTEVHADIGELSRVINELGTNIRGTRLTDLAHVNIELIDRNLYERSCDVRWWATDSSLIDALTHKTSEAQSYACSRMGTILDSYTVYYDIVLCNIEGTVIANGRPERYPSIGTNQSHAPWFKAAMATTSGTEFGFQSGHRSESLAGGQMTLVYSCTVREGGKSEGHPLGVLGIVFNWESLGQTVVKSTQISEDERGFSRICIVDRTGLILADTEDHMLIESLETGHRRILTEKSKAFIIVPYRGTDYILAYAFSPGFETYATGWHSIVLQRLHHEKTHK